MFQFVNGGRVFAFNAKTNVLLMMGAWGWHEVSKGMLV